MTNALQELIQQHCAQTGDTLADIAARGHIARQTVSGLVHRDGPKAAPRLATLRGLATGMGLPFETVQRAAVQSAYAPSENNGDGVHHRRVVDLLTALTDSLPDHDVSVLIATARAMRANPRGHTE